MTKGSKLLLVALAVLGLGACTDSPTSNVNDQQVTGGDPAQCPVAADIGVPRLSDEELVQVVRVINQGEIQLSQLAQQQQPQPQQPPMRREVREFADRMVLEHSQANQQIDAALPVLGITPRDSQLSLQLAAETNQTLAILQTAAPGDDFDRAYMDVQVAMHAKALFIMDTTIQPQLQRAELRQLAVPARELTQNHLNAAMDIQRTIPARP